MNDENPKHNYLYDAFISYNALDNKFAEKLEKILENYIPPKDLDVPRKRLNIFRFQTDMTGTEYYSAIEERIKSSAKLIVICSPNARKSKYVNDEINRFVDFNDPHNIIPVLIDGIPNNEAIKGEEDDKAFPDSLCESLKMPLAINYKDIDLKKDKINRGVYENQWYTLLSNIYGLSREEIEQRDKRRKQKQTRLLVTLVISIILILSSLTIFALIQRDIAQKNEEKANKQRVRAEDNEEEANKQRDRAEDNEEEANKQRDRAEDNEEEANKQRVRAEDNEEEAIKQKNIVEEQIIQLKRSKSNSLAYQSKSMLQQDPTLSFRLAEAAWNTYNSYNARLALMYALNMAPFYINRFKDKFSPISACGFSKNGKIIVTVHEGGIYKFWRMDGSPLSFLYDKNSKISAYAISPSGKFLFITKIVYSGPNKSKLQIWHLNEEKMISEKSTKDILPYLFFSPDEKYVIVLENLAGTIRGQGKSINGKQPLFFNGQHRYFSDACFSFDGKKLVKINFDSTITFWDIENEKIIFEDNGYKKIESAFFSNTDRYIVLENNDGIKYVVDYEGKENISFRDKHNYSSNIEFSPNDDYLVSFSYSDSSLVLWDLNQNTIIFEERLLISSLNFSSSSNRFLTTSRDGVLKVWSTESGLQYSMKIEHKDAYTASFSGQENYIISKDIANNQLLWDLKIQPITFLKDRYNEILDIRVSSDDEYIATLLLNGIAIVWDNEGNEIMQLGNETLKIKTLHFSPDNKYILFVNSENYVERRALIKNILEPFSVNERYSLSSPYITSNGKFIVTSTLRENDNKIQIFETFNNKKIFEGLYNYDVTIRSIFLSSNEEYLIIRLSDYTFRIIDIYGKGSDFLSNGLPSLKWIKESQFGNFICTNYSDNTFKIWNLSKNLIINEKINKDDLSEIIFSSDGEFISFIFNNGKISIWDKNGDYISQLLVNNKISYVSSRPKKLSIVFGHIKKLILTVSIDGNINLWDFNGKFVKDLGNENSIIKAYFSPNDRYIITEVINKNNIKRTIIRTLDGKHVPFFSNFDQEIESVSFSLNGKMIATLYSDKIFRLWHSSGKPFHLPTDKWENVTSVKFSPNSNYVAITFSTGVVKIFDLKGNEISSVADVPGVTGDFSPKGNYILTEQPYGKYRIWDLNGTEVLLSGNWKIQAHNKINFSNNEKYLVEANYDNSLKVWPIDPDEIIRLINKEKIFGEVWNLNDEIKRNYGIDIINN